MEEPTPSKAKQYKNALARNETAVVAGAVRETGFKIEKEIYRNFDTVEGKKYLRSLIYKGRYRGKDAVLKIHGTEAVSRDFGEIRKFDKQNKSKLVRSPKVYSHKWNRASGYGFTIFEYIGTPEIINRPFPTHSQLRDFVRFYEEYRTHAISRPWIRIPDVEVETYLFDKIDVWVKNAKTEKRLKPSDYEGYLARFREISSRFANKIPYEFMHMHLYPEHIRRLSTGEYVLLDHMSWGYRPQWADLSYMVWRTILDIRDNEYSARSLFEYVNLWIKTFKRIPLVKRDKDFDTKIRFLILERIIGIMIGDLGSGKYWGSEQGKKYLKHMLYLNQRLFDHLAKELENKSID
jgi:hypothetical protein